MIQGRLIRINTPYPRLPLLRGPPPKSLGANNSQQEIPSAEFKSSETLWQWARLLTPSRLHCHCLLPQNLSLLRERNQPRTMFELIMWEECNLISGIESQERVRFWYEMVGLTVLWVLLLSLCNHPRSIGIMLTVRWTLIIICYHFYLKREVKRESEVRREGQKTEEGERREDKWLGVRGGR